MHKRIDDPCAPLIRDMSHEVTQRVSEWREKDRIIRARLAEMKHEIEQLVVNSHELSGVLDFQPMNSAAGD